MSDVSVKHAFHSPKVDGPDTTKIRASDWNADLLFTGGTVGDILTRDTGSATGAAWSASPTLTNLTLGSAGTLAWSTDLKLVREAANVLAMRNGTAAQSLRLYGTYTDASNYERFRLAADTAGVYIIADRAGTGVARAMHFWTDGNSRWDIGSTGHFLATTDNTYDIGATGATRPRNIFVASDITTGSTTLHKTSVALTNGAAAQSGTLTNAPTAGNPTKWVPINDNGTTRYIPAW